MATESGRAEDPLVAALQREPWRFEFVQAVRLLGTLNERGDRDLPAVSRRLPVGYATPPDRELLRFRAVLSRSFPPAEVARIEPGNANEGAEMDVAFMGLTGPLGVLPEHYLDLIYQRLRLRDHALRDFFDLFNHRSLSLFYRAWEKYRPAVAYERAQPAGDSQDPLTRIVGCLVGMGTQGLSDRLALPDQAIRAYGGYFARTPRSAWTLEAVLRDHFGIAVKIEQFVGRWLEIEPDQCTRLPGEGVPSGQFNRLGVDTVLGTRAWDASGKFRIRLGPMDYRIYRRFLPTAKRADGALAALADFVGLYAGVDREFDVQLVLSGSEVPRLSAGLGTDGIEPRLGWTTWFAAEALPGDRDEAILPLSVLASADERGDARY